MLCGAVCNCHVDAFLKLFNEMDTLPTTCSQEMAQQGIEVEIARLLHFFVSWLDIKIKLNQNAKKKVP